MRDFLGDIFELIGTNMTRITNLDNQKNLTAIDMKSS